MLYREEFFAPVTWPWADSWIIYLFIYLFIITPDGSQSVRLGYAFRYNFPYVCLQT